MAISSILLPLHIIIVLVITGRVLYRSDLTTSGRLAWTMVLFFLPGLGTLVYFLFGEARIGRKVHAYYKILSERARDYYAEMGEAEKYPADIPVQFESIANYAKTLNGFPALSGNRAELMADAAQFRARLVEDIDGAASSVSILYYIWLTDNTGEAVAEALIRAAARGLKVRVMVDSLGSRALFKSDIWKNLNAAGIETIGALPLGMQLITFLFRRLDVRNHRKITVIDGRITYCGSQNCSDPEFRVKPRYAPWIDIMARIEGPVVNQNQIIFAVDWMVAHENVFTDFDLEGTAKGGGISAQIWGAGPTVRHSSTQQLLTTMIGTARRDLRITTPYFVPDEPLIEALCAAARRGVAVTIILPRRNDSKIVSYASQSNYSVFLEAGVNIQEFEGGLLHAKIMTIDGQVTLMGSTNLDMRSFDINYENNIIIYDEVFTKQVDLRQDEYLASSAPVLASEVKAWPYRKVIWNNIFATLGPIL